MNKIAMVCDTGLDLPRECYRDNVFIMPLKVIRNGELFLDGVTISPEEVAATLAQYDYTTSLASPGEVLELFNSIKAKGYTQLLCVNISSGLSGTANVFRLAAQDTVGLEFEFVDTLNIGIGAGVFGIDAIECIESGMEFRAIAERLRKMVPISHVYFCVGTLEYLIKGGRIGKITGFVGQLLHLKPVITCDFEGIYSTIAKARGKLQGVNKCIDMIVDNYKQYDKINIGITNCNNPEEMDYVYQQITQRLSNINKVFKGVISPALTVHAGPDLIGITAYPLMID